MRATYLKACSWCDRTMPCGPFLRAGDCICDTQANPDAYAYARLKERLEAKGWERREIDSLAASLRANPKD